MSVTRCPNCDRDTAADAITCPQCGSALNGAVPPLNGLKEANDGKLSEELRDWARQQFDENEFWAGMREISETGGLELKDFIQQLELLTLPRAGW